MKLDTITYTRAVDSKEPQIIEFKVSPNLSLKEYRRVCKRLAHSLGYSNKSIEELFGKDADVDDPAQLKILFG